jgi:glycerol uptake facilitator-like aquaporin
MTPEPRSVAAEALGTLALVAIVVGSGIMGERLAAGDVAVALLANTLATAAGLFVVISVLGPLSGAHLNPAVSLVEAAGGRLRWSDAAAYTAAQIGGGVCGVLLAHAMFDHPLLAISDHARGGPGAWLSEVVATSGLVLVILGSQRRAPDRAPERVALYIASAYWFTASTSFANPAVTLARALTDTFSGIRPQDAPPFILAQLVGAAIAAATWPRLDPPSESPP